MVQKLPSKPPQKIVINKRVKTGLPFDVTALSDGDLARQLKSFGATVGPITDSTRPLYQKKLGKSVLLHGEMLHFSRVPCLMWSSHLLFQEVTSIGRKDSLLTFMSVTSACHAPRVFNSVGSTRVEPNLQIC